jgi:adenosine tuberculosinyltransferase
MEHMPKDMFLSLPSEEVANIIRAGGSRVCVFPFNGTRRWFLLEYGRDFDGDAAENYVELTSHGYINVYRLVFDHGIDTVVAPVFGGEILNRGEEYMREIGAGMSLLATHPAFLDFYKTYDIRVHFYGDYRNQLQDTPYAYICNAFDEVVRKTANHSKRRLFYGVWADESTEAIAKHSVRHFQETGNVPSRRELIEQYYGEYIEKADIFIGFEKFNVFDYPMLGWGEESLYFTVAPSLYLSERQLRNVLYDFIYLRPVQDPDYFTMPNDDFEAMRKFYKTNREVTFGVGEMRGGIWYSKSGVRE